MTADNKFAARLRELIQASSLAPWEAGGEVIYDPVAAIGEMYDAANADLVIYLRNHADRLADYIEAGAALATALDRHIASLAGQFADADLAVDAFRDRLAALDRPAP